MGLLLVSPVGFWSYQSGRSMDLVRKPDAVVTFKSSVDSELPLEIPVQVISRGKTPQWIYVQVEPQAVPEPGTLSLIGIAAILLIVQRSRS